MPPEPPGSTTTRRPDFPAHLARDYPRAQPIWAAERSLSEISMPRTIGRFNARGRWFPIGSGASGLAFSDTLLTEEPDVELTPSILGPARVATGSMRTRSFA